MRIALIATDCTLTSADGSGSQPGQHTLLARALAAHGHRVTLYVRRDSSACPRTAILGNGASAQYVTAGPARPVPADQAARYLPAFADDLAGHWRVKRPDVVHAFSWTAGLVAVGAARGLDVPVLQTFESLGSAERRQVAGADVAASRVKIEGSIGRTVATVLARSVAEADELARLGVPKSAIRVIPCGIDTDLFSPDGARAKRGPRPKLIAFAPGGAAPGVESVVRALALLPEAELVIVGGPDARHMPRTGPVRDLSRLASAIGVRSRITFAGEVAQASLPALLRSADIMVSASPYEPAGTAVVQAMACGTPTVVSAVGAHTDAVVDGVTGLLVAPEHPAMLAHRVRMLLARPALLQAFGIAAADRARSRYSLQRISQETAAAYERCVRARSAAALASAEEELAGYPAEPTLREVAGLA
ncbi:MAG TPA: glycosyltransferase [Streptosporangiaceae bacterium]|jgi:glycosyltransferase involved in cell wall biosynthesis|nr:glycosyltransferase [Streptosporangiaceae bacterium]